MSDSIQALFLKGRHADLLGAALLDAGARFEPHETPYVVASLALVGQIGDAELLLRHQQELLGAEEQLFAHVHLALAATTSARYPTARRHLGRAAALRDQTSDPEGLFLLYHGLAQYRYATGRLGAATRSLHRALQFVKRAPRDYALLLSHELAGHIKALTGDARAALAHFGEAIQLATKLERHDLARTLQLSRTLYEARYVLGPKDALKRLRLAETQLATTDVFPRLSLLLESSRQELLRKRENDARAAFEAASQALVGLDSRRYEAAAMLRLVDLALAAGDASQALLLIQTAERTLASEADDLPALELASRRVDALRRLVAAVDPTRREARLMAALDAAFARYAKLLRRTGFQAPEAPRTKPKPKDPGLNHRQLALLEDLDGRTFVDVQTYRRRFDVSEITASRDLAALARCGYLMRIGRARATRYARASLP